MIADVTQGTNQPVHCVVTIKLNQLMGSEIWFDNHNFIQPPHHHSPRILQMRLLAFILTISFTSIITIPALGCP